MAGSGKLGCVVVSVDGSEESMNGLKWALENVKLRSSQEKKVQDGRGGSESSSSSSSPGYILVLHVQSPPSIAAGLNPGNIPFGGPENIEVPAFAKAIETHQKRISEAIIDHALKICYEKQVNVKTEVVIGEPKDTICDFVDKVHADLLVMGCRAFGPIKRMFLGSVSNYCTNHAQCPVVVVKGSA